MINKDALFLVQLGLAVLAILETLFVLERLFFGKRVKVRDWLSVGLAYVVLLIWLFLLTGWLTDSILLLLVLFLIIDKVSGRKKGNYVNRKRSKLVGKKANERELASVAYAYLCVLLVGMVITALTRTNMLWLSLGFGLLQYVLVSQVFLIKLRRLMSLKWTIFLRLLLILTTILPIILKLSEMMAPEVIRLSLMFSYLLTVALICHFLSLVSLKLLKH